MSKEKLVPRLRFESFLKKLDWQYTKLGEVADIVGGGTPSTQIEKYWNGDINWFSPTEIGETSYLNSSERKITKLGLKKSSAKILPIGTVLFTSRAGIGKTAILEKESTTNQGFQSIVPKKNILNSYFIYSRSEEIKNYAEIVGAGSTFVEVSGKQLEKMMLLIPELKEQQKIGSFFEKIDKMIQLQQSKVNKVKDIKSAYLSEMFPKEGEKYPKRRFGGFIKPWIQYELGDLAPLRGGNSFQSNKFVDKGVPIVRISNILTNETVGGSFVFYEEQTDDERFLLPHKSAVLAMSGATTGKVSILNNPNNQKVYQNQRIGYFRDIGVVNYSLISTLVKSLLFDRQLKDVLVTGAQPNVSPKEIDSFVFLIPNDKEEQKKIAEFFENLDNQIAIEEEKLVKLEKLKQAYLNDMFV